MSQLIDASTTRQRWAALRPFDSPGYRLLWSATTLWHLIRWMDMIVMGWLVLEMTNSPWHVALIGFYRSLPLLAFGLVASALLDQVERRRLIVFSQGISLASSAAVFILVALGTFTFTYAVVANLLLGLTWAIDWQTRRGLIPDLVGKDLVLSAVILESMSMNVTKVLGPIAGGSLIPVIGVANCYGLMSLLYVIQIALILRMPSPPHVVESRSSSVLRYLGEGWREILRNQPIFGVLAITVAANVFVFPYQQLLPVFARDVLATGPVGLGVLGAGNGIGTLIGLLLLMRLGKPRWGGLTFILGSFAMSAALLGFATSTSYSLSLLLLIVSGLGQSAFSAFQSAIVLVNAADSLRGRALSALTLAIGTAPFGLLEVGALAQVAGAPIALGVNTAIAAGMILAVAFTVPGLRRH